uniref:Uncharacterized protein n=1 Tax=Rhizoctonia solani TaxID=456999 RepID=N0A5A8_9AGAM|nr:hypothetical protein RSOL_m01200 [Rhizoctonia solani]AGK45433.1 hypothetical protein RSOL_m01200 [Rhizoctonia solani]
MPEGSHPDSEGALRAKSLRVALATIGLGGDRPSEKGKVPLWGTLPFIGWAGTESFVTFAQISFWKERKIMRKIKI